MKSYSLSDITTSGIGLGPITLYRYPNTTGIDAWKFLFKSYNYIVKEPPISKEGQDLAPWIFDWNILRKWYKSNWDSKTMPIYVPYEQVRSLETRILNSSTGVVKKATMKYIIDSGKNVATIMTLKSWAM